MIGIFDSGRGGVASARILRALFPLLDIAYIADRKNAPYGTKTEGELLQLVCEDIRRLRELGCEKILIACCTASTVYEGLPEEYKSVCVPIVAPTARAAASLTKNRKIAVIATEATVSSGAFSARIKECDPSVSVREIAAQELVGLIECGADEGRLRRRIEKICREISSLGADTLILGCTHFSHVKNTFADFLGNIRAVDSASVGALEIAKTINTRENGKILYA